MNKAFVDFLRCPDVYADFSLTGTLSRNAGYFLFGPDTVCFGQTCSGFCAKDVTSDLYDVSQDVRIDGSRCFLPFNVTSLIGSLRYEQYVETEHRNGKQANLETLIRDAYYLVRPILPVSVRKHLQRVSLRGWDKISFPNWPVDRTVHQIIEKLLILSMKAHRVNQIPFVWFWPDGYSSCAIITHDVETSSGLDFCATLMDIDDSFGIKASFQIVPEGRYAVSQDILGTIRDRGFEVNLHDLNHDGRLFWDENEFRHRASRINQYAERYGTKGFRSAVLYRNLNWYDAFAFSYDMSVPNVGHLDPQRGGCCTVMPYFIGDVLELPLTTTQDYSLYYILEDYSIELWKRQISLIMEKCGLISFNIHPDYVIGRRARNLYTALLRHLAQFRSDAKIWFALPGDVDTWWRERSRLKLSRYGNAWQIEGPGKERARIAYASLEKDHLVYAVEKAP